MRVALFGGTGFVGNYLIDELLANRMHPVLLVRPGSEQKTHQVEQCTFIQGDIENSAAIAETLQDADAAIFNIGILREFPRRGITFRALQFEAAKRCIDAAVAAGVKRFVLMSANGVKADGTAYQKSKFMAEQYLQTTTMDWTVFRPSVLFGDPRGHMEFATQLCSDIILSPLPAPLFYSGLLPKNAGGFEMAPVHVKDVAYAFVKALQTPSTIGQTLTLCGPENVSWRKILETIQQPVNRKKLMLPAPAWGVSAVAALLERFPAFPITRDQISMLLEGNTCDGDDLRTLVDNPITFTADNLHYLSTLDTASD